MQQFFKIALIGGAFLLMSQANAWTTITVQSGETIDGIAAKYKPSTVSSMDMVIAVRSANPGVEKKGLQSGTKLKIPTNSAEVRQALTGQIVASKSVAPPPLKPKAVVVKPTVAKPVVTKPVTVKPTVAKSVVTKPVAIKPIVAKPVPVVVDNSSQVANLQQALQLSQAEVTNLINQLNQLSQTPPPPTRSLSLFSFGDVWFVLWVGTLILWMRSRLKSRRIPPVAHVVSEPIEPSIAVETLVDVTSHPEPVPHDFNEEEWRQVELDIPASDAPAQTHMPLSPSFSIEEEEALSGEQKNIVDAIAGDHDNLDWHMALLEFHIKTLNKAGFKRHMDTTARTGLMAEGDGLWERVRAMYLNAWIYVGGKA